MSLNLVSQVEYVDYVLDQGWPVGVPTPFLYAGWSGQTRGGSTYPVSICLVVSVDQGWEYLPGLYMLSGVCRLGVGVPTRFKYAGWSKQTMGCEYLPRPGLYMPSGVCRQRWEYLFYILVEVVDQGWEYQPCFYMPMGGSTYPISICPLECVDYGWEYLPGLYMPGGVGTSVPTLILYSGWSGQAWVGVPTLFLYARWSWQTRGGSTYPVSICLVEYVELHQRLSLKKKWFELQWKHQQVLTVTVVQGTIKRISDHVSHLHQKSSTCNPLIL